MTNNTFFSKDPFIYSEFKDTTTGDYVVNQDDVCRIYVENWVGGTDKIPSGFMAKSLDKIASLINSGNLVSRSKPYYNFMIDSIQPVFQDTVVPQKNIGSGFTTYVFGDEPPTVAIGGVLVNTKYDKWSEIFMALYLNFLRASKLAELSVINGKDYYIVLRYQNKLLKGSIISFSKSVVAANEQAVRFNMTFLLKELGFMWESSATDFIPTKDSTEVQKSIAVEPTPQPTATAIADRGVNVTANHLLLNA